ncbi:diguanylate cyclase (GGDEF)-like protein [Desulfobaculum xiamenense]|uniref:diguanylate cyclase n=1 Tax=Desulfobaculum xiamenense TaxID=995050 RepID=A0A846QIP2_9BACT|nr:sensor domain-containing diguanylate cyclase [Desulfobaculum xiamenense]NJB66927.1 diguanylate cyclase (GGDEF)-like protein [Desulfobaculum xiamenense]
MQNMTSRTLLWGFGLNDIDRKKIETASGSGYELRNWTPDALPQAGDVERDEPLVLWIPIASWDALDTTRREEILGWDSVQKVLLQNGTGSDVSPEAYVDMGFLSVLGAPLRPAAISDALLKAIEVRNLYDDIMRMTREISLEREILARKNDYLLFLNRVMARAVESLNPATIITQARQDLNMLFPVSAAQCIFWHETGRESVEAELFLAFHEHSDIQEAWVELLLKTAAKLSTAHVDSYQLTFLLDAAATDDGVDLSPRPGQVILLPLKAGGRDFGCLALLTPEQVRLGREQRDVLHSAANHLGLALKNALLYREVKIRADHDGLTRIYNRQYFDERLVDELKRARRYSQDISLLLLDIDHFKAVNDTYGHQAGDAVLKDVGALLLETLRSTDFPARYGGEEFAVILPHTCETKAWNLAERLRQKIARMLFAADGKNFTITTSIGVASIPPGAFKKNVDILRQADRALYLAKASGRNMVCTSLGCEDDADQPREANS